MQATGLPAAFEFRLPRGWAPASGFTANITVEGVFRADVVTLPEVADESVAALRRVSPDLTVADRGELGDPADPGFVQQLRMTAVVNGATWDVLQSQVYISMRAAGGQRAQTVVRAVLTCTVAQFGSMVGDFDAFLATLRFAPDS